MTDYRKELTGLAGYFADPSPKTSAKHKNMVRQLVELGEKMGTEMPETPTPRVWWSVSQRKLFYTESAIGTQMVMSETAVDDMPTDVVELYADDVAAHILAANEDFGKAQVQLTQLLGMRPDQNASQIRNRIEDIVNAAQINTKTITTQQVHIESLNSTNASLQNSYNELQASLHTRCDIEETHAMHMWLTPKGYVSACDGKELDGDDSYEYYDEY
jgi:hypothetical protein